MGTVKEAAQSSAQDGKLALLFLIKEGPNNPGVWRRWLQDAPADRYSITVHAKHTDLVHAEQFKRNWWASLCAYARTRARACACAPHTHTHTHTHTLPPSLPPSLPLSPTSRTPCARAHTHKRTRTAYRQSRLNGAPCRSSRRTSNSCARLCGTRKTGVGLSRTRASRMPYAGRRGAGALCIRAGPCVCAC